MSVVSCRGEDGDGLVGGREMTAGRSPCWETMEEKCWGMVVVRSGGWEGG